MADPVAGAQLKAEAAFESCPSWERRSTASTTGTWPPKGRPWKETVDRLRRMVDVLGAAQEATGVRLLWGTANMFSHRRWMAGAATNPDPEVFAMACLSVKEAMDATVKLGGQNYVLWGGREGYETLLNTDLKAELEQMGRFLCMAVDYKHKIGLSGPLLVEPKPRNPPSTSTDYDVATVAGPGPAGAGTGREAQRGMQPRHPGRTQLRA